MKTFSRKNDAKITRILITNDDGIGSLGLKCLAKALSALPNTEVYISVPAEQQSGMSHAIVLAKKLRVDEVEFPGAVRAMTIASTPADACLFGLDILAADGIHPDIVFSGINHGWNTAGDVPYSGTVGAASEGAMDGIPSVAISTEIFPPVTPKRPYVETDFEAACEAAVKMIPVALNAKTDYIFNVNVPNCPPSEIKGWKVTDIGYVFYDMELKKETDEDGHTCYYYGVKNRVFGTEETHPGTDTAALQDGYVSVSLVRTDFNDRTDAAKYREIMKDWTL